MGVSWTVAIGDEFAAEFDKLHEDVRIEILALSRVLQQFGPQMGRPRVDTLNGSRHPNMKELRFGAADGEWRLPLIPGARPSSWWPVISPAGVKRNSTRTSSQGPIAVLART